MPNDIRLDPNIPATLALRDVEGRYDPDKETVEYQTTDGRTLTVAAHVAARINLLDLVPGEEFGICKRWEGQPAHVQWDVWLTPRTEQARFEAEKLQDAAPQAPAPVQQPSNGKQPVPIRKGRKPKFADQPRLFDRGTGTYGPAPIPMPAIAAATRHMPIPWNIAFREVAAWVSKELAANNLQWSDQAQQAMVCTVCIQEARAGRIGPWERGE